MKVTKQNLISALQNRFVSLKNEFDFDYGNGFAQVEKSSEVRQLFYFRFRTVEHLIMRINDGEIGVNGNNPRFSKKAVLDYLNHYVEVYTKAESKLKANDGKSVKDMKKQEVVGSLIEYKYLIEAISSDSKFQKMTEQ